jgi:hypothetical protein
MSTRSYLIHAVTLLAICAVGLLGFIIDSDLLFSSATFTLLLGSLAQLIAVVGFAAKERTRLLASKATFSLWCGLMFPFAVVTLPNWTPLFAAVAAPVGFLMAYLLISILKVLWSVVHGAKLK